MPTIALNKMGRTPKWRDVWFIIAFWVCLMSGIASLAREAITLFLPKLVAPTQVFQACVVTCFVISAWVVLYRQNARIHELERRTPAQEDRLKLIRDVIGRHGDPAIRLLRHLRLVGYIAFGRSAPNLPAGMESSGVRELLALLKTDGLVFDETMDYDISSPLQQMFIPRVWRISPGIEPLLDEILYQ
jgi:hypothetical protein